MSLERIEPDALTIQQLLEAAKRNLNDAQIEGVSNEDRFDAAYKAIVQMAHAALQASGYRTLTSKPGHHQTMIQIPSPKAPPRNRTAPKAYEYYRDLLLSFPKPEQAA